MVSETLPKSLRLRRRRDFSRVQRHGARGGAGPLQAVVQRARGPGRFGLTVPKKVGNAVVRNKVKRRLREILRRERSLFEGIELVVICSEGTGELELEPLRETLQRAVGRAREALERQPARRPGKGRPGKGRQGKGRAGGGRPGKGRPGEGPVRGDDGKPKPEGF
jgi:ribonuclease P protein component